MKFKEIVHNVWQDERVRALKIKKSEVEVVLIAFSDCIFKALIEDGKVKFRNLFTLTRKKNKGRRISNPQTKEHMYSNDYYRIGLKPSKRLEDGLKNIEE